MTEEPDPGSRDDQAARPLENFDHRDVALDLEDATAAGLPGWPGHLDHLIGSGPGDPGDDDDRPLDSGDADIGPPRDCPHLLHGVYLRGGSEIVLRKLAQLGLDGLDDR